MIVEAIVRIVMLPFWAALAVLPEIAPLDLLGLVDTAAPIWQFGGWVNNWVPLSETATLLGVFLAAYLAITVVRAILWVLVQLHILGGAA